MVIGLLGKARSGKDTAGKILEKFLHDKGYKSKCFAFGDEVKKICKLFGARNEELYINKTEKSRRLMQVIGTEAGREYNPNIWIEKLTKDEDYIEYINDGVAIITDVRFVNEADYIRSVYGQSILIERQKAKVEIGSNHASETGIDEIIKNYPLLINHKIQNNGTLNDLKLQLIKIIKKLEKCI